MPTSVFVGEALGAAVTALIGAAVGPEVVGATVLGAAVLGAAVGPVVAPFFVGVPVVGAALGPADGAAVGAAVVGAAVGAAVGPSVAGAGAKVRVYWGVSVPVTLPPAEPNVNMAVAVPEVGAVHCTLGVVDPPEVPVPP